MSILQVRKVRLRKVESLPKSFLAGRTEPGISPGPVSELVPLTPEFCSLPKCLVHPGAATAPRPCLRWGVINQDPCPPSCPGMFPRQLCKYLAPGKPPTITAQVGSSWHLEPQQALVQAPQQPLRSPAGSHLLCGGLGFLLAVRRPSRELGFQAGLCKRWKPLQGAGLEGDSQPGGRGTEHACSKPCVNIALVRGKAACFSSPPAPKPFPKYPSQDYTAAVCTE